ncbi:integrin alpha FG-GAP repeat containing 1 [Perkinsus chesapeaki]|uniref:Integrin alpha FG-GAP repeat containing 1 n=1 Tax=Perkinsus chesapeaki TaxID=330153 RepID=A0A7J6LJL0_PERCH|nr:integrin alpha FG-GAP repeat containing 1 [Perkinsus chesapeaki]
MIPYLIPLFFPFLLLLLLTSAAQPHWPLYGQGAVDLKLENVPGDLAAFVDINGDKLTDLVFVERLVIHFWTRKTDASFESFRSLDLAAESQNITGLSVYTVLPLDWNLDGKMDAYVIMTDGGRSPKFTILALEGDDNFDLHLKWMSSQPIIREPIVVDIDGDGTFELLGENGDVWFGNGTFTEAYLPDGDCQNDIVLDVVTEDGSRALEVWLWKPEDRGYHKLPRRVPLTQATDYVTFADFTGTGTNDALLVQSDGTIHLYENTQMPLCQKSGQHGCRSDAWLCTSDPNFRIGGYVLNGTDPSEPVVYRLGQISNMQSGDAYSPVIVGDVDANGLPDLLVGTTTGACLLWNLRPSHEGLPPETILDCSDGGQAGSIALIDIRQTQADDYHSKEDDKTGGGATGLVIMIIDELGNGRVYTPKAPQSGTDGKSITDEVSHQYYLKALARNGACDKGCYGVSTPGATFKVTVLSISGEESVRIASPTAVGARRNLGLPYAYIGLGDTNNYIPRLALGYAGEQSSWVSLVPNTFVVANPHPLDDPHQWSVELAISPSRYLPMIVAVAAGALGVLGFVIMVLDVVDRKRETRRNAEQFGSHLFGS